MDENGFSAAICNPQQSPCGFLLRSRNWPLRSKDWSHLARLAITSSFSQMHPGNCLTIFYFVAFPLEGSDEIGFSFLTSKESHNVFPVSEE
jgi:hypothetical protein